MGENVSGCNHHSNQSTELQEGFVKLNYLPANIRAMSIGSVKSILSIVLHNEMICWWSWQKRLKFLQPSDRVNLVLKEEVRNGELEEQLFGVGAQRLFDGKLTSTYNLKLRNGRRHWGGEIHHDSGWNTKVLVGVERNRNQVSVPERDLSSSCISIPVPAEPVTDIWQEKKRKSNSLNWFEGVTFTF